MRYKLPLLFLAVSLLVLGPLLLPGYVLTLDMVFGPHFVAEFGQGQVLAAWPVFKLIGILSSIIPNWLIQKGILIAILFLSGLNMAYLLRDKSQNTQIIAGLFYMLNPFVYTRFLAGHWLILMGYALLPLWIALYMDVFKTFTRKKFLTFLFLTNAIIIISYHQIWFMILIALVTFFMQRKKICFRKFRNPLLLFGAITFLIQSYWLIPLSMNTTITNLSATLHLSYFGLSGSSTLHTILLALTGYGFWGQGQGFGNQFMWLSSTPIFVISLLLLIVAIVGFISYQKKKKELHNTIIIFSATLALLISLLALTPVGVWLYDTTPGLMMMRDTHKWIELWMLFTALGLGYGWHQLESIIKSQQHRVVYFTLFILLISVQSQTMFFGFKGQLKSTDFPKSWYEVREILREQPEQSTIVFPWHQYMSFDFNDNLLTLNPAFRFFDTPLIYTQVPMYFDKPIVDLQEAYEEQYTETHFVLVLKEVDYEDYDIQLPIKYESEDVILYERI